MKTEVSFKMYDVVRLKASLPVLTAAIRGIQHNRTMQDTIYKLRSVDGLIIEAMEHELDPTGDFEAPLHYDEIVEIWSQEPKHAHLRGGRGVITGISVDDKTREWYFSITIQTGECLFFSNKEVRSVGRTLPQSVKDMMTTQSLTIQVDNDSGEGILLEGDSSIDIHRYIPYPVDLNDL